MAKARGQVGSRGSVAAIEHPYRAGQRCPNCGVCAIEQRGKLVCPECGTIIESCCD